MSEEDFIKALEAQEKGNGIETSKDVKTLLALGDSIALQKNKVSLDKNVARNIIENKPSVTKSAVSRYNLSDSTKMKKPFIIAASLGAILIIALMINLINKKQSPQNLPVSQTVDDTKVATLSKGNSDQELSQDVTATQQDEGQIDSSLKEIDQDLASSSQDSESQISEN